ncbi:MAG TPA: heme ABC transporter permease CcmC [Chloroflexota bacterium]|nr:heme ABC transporter permease CcmC [Chloroflexota bacterium]
MQRLDLPPSQAHPLAGLFSERSGVSLALVAMLSMGAALYAALLYAPTERIQGDVQRIFYFHVPLAWTSYLAFFVVFVASAAYLVKRAPLMDAVARSSAEVGLLFTTMMLITGSLWARPIWGTWWSWDARLTTTLLLWFIYVGYLMLRSSVDDEEKAARYAAVIGIVGAVDIPIIHQSVVWWRSLHPESVVLASGGPAMPGSMLTALLVSLAAFTILYVVLVLMRTRLELARVDLRALRRRALERVA